jgi:cytochrome oxidase assembly protein ShyY1
MMRTILTPQTVITTLSTKSVSRMLVFKSLHRLTAGKKKNPSCHVSTTTTTSRMTLQPQQRQLQILIQRHKNTLPSSRLVSSPFRINHLSPNRMYLSSSPTSSSSSTTVVPPTVSPPPTTTTTTTTPPPTATIGVLGTLFFGSLCVGTFVLGSWQTKRYYEKTKLVQQRNSDLQSEPVAYEEYCQEIQLQQSSSSSKQPDSPIASSFRKIQLHGIYHHEYEILVGPRGPPPGSTYTTEGGMSSSPQGYYIITPLEIQRSGSDFETAASTTTGTPTTTSKESQYVLINRGWVPRHMVVGPSNTRNQPHPRRPTMSNPNTSATKEGMSTWDRPRGRISVTVVPTQGEGMWCIPCLTLYIVCFR